MPDNRQYRLAKRPVGVVQPSDFDLVTTPTATPGPGEALVRVQYVSLDPAMRGWMNDAKSYLPPVAIGEVMRAGAVGRVVASNDPKLAVGDVVVGTLGVQDYALVPAAQLHKIDPRLAPLPRWLGALGMPGMTAWFGLFDVGRPQPGETVVVSGAAGAVGALVGQLAKLHGCRVVGIAGGAEKCAYLGELGFDAAIDYKHENVPAALKQHCGKGIDIYFDNVGGDILDAALARLAFKGRVVLCGAISQYNATSAPRGPANYLSLLVNRGRMEGFIVLDYLPRWGEGVRDMAQKLASGKIQAREDVVDGLTEFVPALNKLFTGENFGKLVLRVDPEA